MNRLTKEVGSESLIGLKPRDWQIIDLVRGRKQLTQAQLVAQTALPFSTISTTVGSLVQRELLIKTPTETSEQRSKRGSLMVNPAVGYFLGVSVRKNLVETLSLDFGFNIIGSDTTPLDTYDHTFITNLRSILETRLEEIPDQTLLGVGLSWPGHVTNRELHPSPAVKGEKILVALTEVIPWRHWDRIANILTAKPDTYCAVLAEKTAGGYDMQPLDADPLMIVLVDNFFRVGLFINGRLYQDERHQVGWITDLEKEVNRGPQVFAKALGTKLGELSHFIPPQLVIVNQLPFSYDQVHSDLNLAFITTRNEAMPLRQSYLGTTALAFGAAISSYQNLSHKS